MKKHSNTIRNKPLTMIRKSKRANNKKLQKNDFFVKKNNKNNSMYSIIEVSTC